MTMKSTYHVTGLDCIEEVKALRQTVGTLDGVSNIEFNLMKGTFQVFFENEPLSDATIIQAIKTAGFDGTPINIEKGTPFKTSIDCSFWNRRGRLVLCVSSGVLCLLGFLAHVFLHNGFIHALAGNEAGQSHNFPFISIILFVSAAIAGGFYILPKAFLAIRRLQPDMNLLMTIAAIGAMAIGEWFEAATVTFLFALSLLLESWSVGRARKAVEELLNLSPATARCRNLANGTLIERPIEEVLLETVILVKPGERFPLDGVITEGSTTVNQAPLTGESIPVSREKGEEVYAGTINETGSVEVRTTRLATDTRLAHIIHLVEEAQSRRAPSEQWVETFARYYTPLMMVASIVVAVVPPLVFGGHWSEWFYQALVLLVIACPCALVISTPVSIVAALTSAARAGVLIKGGAYLEVAAKIKVIAFDKTGTITQGHPEVQTIVALNQHTERELLERAAALESHSDHPLAKAIMRRAVEEGVSIPEASDYSIIKGKGAEAVVFGRPFWLGNHRLMHEKGTESSPAHEAADAMEDAGHSVVAIGTDNHICGVISVADSIRPEASKTLRMLKEVGILRTVLLTGDNQGTANAVGKEVGIDEVFAELLPEDKMKAVEDLIQRYGSTAMVGDGINDAPALATATLGIAMGGIGTDAAIETADIALMSDDITKIPWLIGHAKRTLRVIRQNIAFALCVKAIFMALALAQLATLWMAIAADMGASLIVIFNALRLLDGKEERKPLQKTKNMSCGCNNCGKD
jgi:Cd2+/Zn2+-exporting ATPase